MSNFVSKLYFYVFYWVYIVILCQLYQIKSYKFSMLSISSFVVHFQIFTKTREHHSGYICKSDYSEDLRLKCILVSIHSI